MSREAEQFFAAYHIAQVEQARRAARRAVWLAVGVVALVVAALAGALWAVMFRPAAVVESCPATAAESPVALPRPQVLLFFDHFVDRYSAQRPVGWLG